MILSNPTKGITRSMMLAAMQSWRLTSWGEVRTPWSFMGLGTFQAGDTSTCSCATPRPAVSRPTTSATTTITNAALIGTVGTNWNFAGIGDFDGAKQPVRAFAAQRLKRCVRTLSGREQSLAVRKAGGGGRQRFLGLRLRQLLRLQYDPDADAGQFRRQSGSQCLLTLYL